MSLDGFTADHSSTTQSLYARKQARPSSRSFMRMNFCPAKPHIPDGKQTEATIPARSMSRRRSLGSQTPRRISSNCKGSVLHSFIGRPLAPFQSPIPSSTSSILQKSPRGVPRTIFGARSANCLGSRPSKSDGGSRT